MKGVVTSVVGAALLSWTLGHYAISQDRSVRLLSRGDVEAYYRVQELLDNKKGNLFRKLVLRYGYKEFYTPDQVQYPFGPKKSDTDVAYTKYKDEDRHLPVPPGAFSREDTFRILKIHALRTGSKENLPKALVSKFGEHPWYEAFDIRDVEDNGSKNAKVPAIFPDPEIPPGWQPIPNPLYNVKIRQSWSDVLSLEDPTVADLAKKKVGDLVGATFSYARDYKSSNNSWSAVGAILYPFEWKREESRSLLPIDLLLVPSVSIDRVSGTSTKSAVDELYFRLGTFAKFLGPSGSLDTVLLRAAPVFGTDLEFDARLPAYELEIEPSITWANPTRPNVNQTLIDYFKIGYKNILLKKKPDSVEQTDQSMLDYQIRGWLHLEGGDLERVGSQWTAVKGSFERMGPELQLRINAPTLFSGVSFTAAYSYLPSLQGPKGRDSLVKLDLTFPFYTDAELQQKVSLNFDYTRGNLDFTKQDVDTFTVGLSVLY
jgi:hypothetical protein